MQLYVGDSLAILQTLDENSVDAVVTDPPYGLGKQPDMLAVLRCWLEGETYEAKGGGFMGKRWDAFVPGPSIWREIFRVLKPGGHVISFFGTRTYDLGVLAMRIAGFEIRDQLTWLYGTGRPKGRDIGKDLGKPWEGWGTGLKPAQEPIVLARKPLAGTVARNVLGHGTGGLNVDGCRIGTEGGCKGATKGDIEGIAFSAGLNGERAHPVPGLGRWPANVILDEQAAGMLDEQQAGASRFFYVPKASKAERERGLEEFPGEGRKNTHPTVKPIALMRYLVRLVTPPGGVVLDPFMGSGSTGCAAKLEGVGFVGVDLDPDYVAIAEARIGATVEP